MVGNREAGAADATGRLSDLDVWWLRWVGLQLSLRPITRLSTTSFGSVPLDLLLSPNMRTTLGFAAAALASLTSARSDQCQIHSATFGKFDLRGLRKSSGDWEVENTNGDLYNLK